MLKQVLVRLLQIVNKRNRMEPYEVCECGNGVKVGGDGAGLSISFCPQCGEAVADIAEVNEKIMRAQMGIVNEQER
jgi:hypothetical protein